MEKIDISEFKEGDRIVSLSGIVYEVMEFVWKSGSRKRFIVGSRCKNIDTGRESVVTWGVNKIFRLYEGE